MNLLTITHRGRRYEVCGRSCLDRLMEHLSQASTWRDVNLGVTPQQIISGSLSVELTPVDYVADGQVGIIDAVNPTTNHHRSLQEVVMRDSFFVYRASCAESGDRYCHPKLREQCGLRLLDQQVRVSYDEQKSGPVHVFVGQLVVGSFDFCKDVRLSVDGTALHLHQVRGMGGFPAWPSIARDLSAGVFVVKGSIFTDPFDAVDLYLSLVTKHDV